MKFVKVIALVLILTMSLTVMAACGSDTSYIIQSGEVKYPSNVYAYFAYNYKNYYQQYANQMGITLKTYLSDYANEAKTVTYSEAIDMQIKSQYIKYIILTQKFDELGLKFSQEDIDAMDKRYKTNWPDILGEKEMNKILDKIGMTEEEFIVVNQFDYKQNAIIDYFYGEGGEFEISEETKKENADLLFSRFKFINLSVTDENGAALSDEEIAFRSSLINEIMAKIDAGAVFEDLIAEYSEAYYKYDDEQELTDEITNRLTYNQLLIEDGYYINIDGAFDNSGNTMPTEIVDAVFSSEVGEYKKIDRSSGGWWIIKRYSIFENPEFYSAISDSVLNAIIENEASVLVDPWYEAFEHTFNEATVKKYNMNKCEDIFAIFATIEYPTIPDDNDTVDEETKDEVDEDNINVE